MSYTPQTWANGDIITATKLNNIESGVQSVSNSYTPTTWVNGDIITATKLNNIEQGIANAGGGSSDFSTATMSVICEDWSKMAQVVGASIDEDHNVATMYYGEVYGGDEVPIVIYKDGALIQVSSQYTITPSGDITPMNNNKYLVTGDCTITIS